MSGPTAATDRIERLSDETLAKSGGPVVIGICGAQGSGKSTVSEAVARRLRDKGKIVALLSLDDLYLSRQDRGNLAAQVHPLLATRGVPGTHDVALGIKVIDDLTNGRPTALPRFDKATDDHVPREWWPPVTEPVDLVLFEGWCVGAVPEEAAALATPVNRLEAVEDVDGLWRRYVNRALEQVYAGLFSRLNSLALLAAPDFTVVARWRREQEHALREDLRRRGVDTGRTISDAGIGRFIGHYERLTRHILAEMPARADLVLRLDAHRKVVAQYP